MAQNRFYNKGYPQYGKAATVMQRRFRKKKGYKKPYQKPYKKANPYRNKQLREVKSIESAIATNQLVYNTGSQANGPSNSLILLPVQMQSQIEAGVANNQVIGQWLVPRYCQHKYTIVADGINPINVPFTNVFETYGYLKISPEKFNADRTTITTWSNAVAAEVRKELYDNGFDSDYCTWTQLNRNVHCIVKKRKLHFSQASKAVSANSLTGSGTGVSDIAPPICRTVDFSKMLGKNKTRLEVIAGGTDQVCGNLWIPFIMLDCPQLISGETMSVRNASKFYFSDP